MLNKNIMKKCQTEKEFIASGNKKNKKSLNIKTIISKIPKIPKIILNIPLTIKKFSRIF